MIGHRRLRALVLLVIASASPAGANVPPLSAQQIVTERNLVEVEDTFHACAEVALRDDVYGAVEVDVTHGAHPVVRLGRTRLLRPADVACVRHALQGLKLTPFEGPGFHTRKWLPVGSVRPLFPAAFLPIWKASVTDPGRDPRAVRSMLPTEVRVTAPGCLRFRGPDPIAGAFYAWLDRTGGEHVGSIATPYFAFSGGWWIRIAQRPHAHDDEMIEETICLDRVDAAVSALRRNENRIFQIMGTGTTFDADFVVDATGRAAGQVGLCLKPAPHLYGAAEAESRRARLAAEIGRLDFGRRAGFERIVLHYSLEGQTRTQTWAADGQPLCPNQYLVEVDLTAAAFADTTHLQHRGSGRAWSTCNRAISSRRP